MVVVSMWVAWWCVEAMGELKESMWAAWWSGMVVGELKVSMWVSCMVVCGGHG